MNKRGKLSSILIATVLFIAFVSVFGTMAVKISNDYNVEIPVEYNESFTNLDQLNEVDTLATSLDITKEGQDQDQGLIAQVTSWIERKFQQAWGIVTFIPDTLTIISSLFKNTTDLLGLEAIWGRVLGIILTIVIMITILSIFLKTNAL